MSDFASYSRPLESTRGGSIDASPLTAVDRVLICGLLCKVGEITIGESVGALGSTRIVLPVLGVFLCSPSLWGVTCISLSSNAKSGSESEKDMGGSAGALIRGASIFSFVAPSFAGVVDRECSKDPTVGVWRPLDRVGESRATVMSLLETLRADELLGFRGPVGGRRDGDSCLIRSVLSADLIGLLDTSESWSDWRGGRELSERSLSRGRGVAGCVDTVGNGLEMSVSLDGDVGVLGLSPNWWIGLDSVKDARRGEGGSGVSRPSALRVSASRLNVIPGFMDLLRSALVMGTPRPTGPTPSPMLGVRLDTAGLTDRSSPPTDGDEPREGLWVWWIIGLERAAGARADSSKDLRRIAAKFPLGDDGSGSVSWRNLVDVSELDAVRSLPAVS